MTIGVKSLKARGEDLSSPDHQIQLLEKEDDLPKFEEKAGELIARSPEIFQVNLGKMCNQVCKHCHVDAGPDRKEIMIRETMEQCLAALDRSTISTVDLTGGAPEMNPHFRWFVEELSARGKHIMVRCNLTIIVANKKYHDFPGFYKRHKVEVVSSLPFYDSSKTDRQRGNGVFEDSIKALKMLNKVGYGIDGSGLILNLVYNPAGAFLPTGQKGLEQDFKKALKKDFDIDFNQLFAITNMPISRFLEFLVRTGNYEGYMEKLVGAYNPSATQNVMCKNTISISWDGYMYDCDFNQMLELKVDQKNGSHVKEFNTETLHNRTILTGRHCFGCTAGAGSSCGGEVVE